MKNKIIGAIGILVFILFVVSFSTFLFVINPGFYKQFDGISMAAYNMNIVEGLIWVRLFNYLLVGLLMVLFSVGLFIISKNSGTNKVASIFLVLSGFIWISLGVINYNIDGSDFETVFLLLRITICLTLGALGFILFGNELDKITNSIKIKWIIFSLGVLIVINGFLDFFITSNPSSVYPNFMSYFSWVTYFLGYAVIGFSLLKQKSETS